MKKVCPLFRACAFYVAVLIGGTRVLCAAVQVHEDRHAYRVEGVDVDVTAASAVQAHETAIAQGQVIAFRALLDQILPSAQQHTVAPWNSEEFLEHFEIRSEKFSNLRVVASLSYTFNKKRLKAKLATLGLRPASAPAAPYVVVPVVMHEGQSQLWEGNNLWLQAWAQNTSDVAVPIVVPLGDLNDIVSLKAADAVALNAKAIEHFAHQHRAQGAVVAFFEDSGVRAYVVQEGEVSPLILPDLQAGGESSIFPQAIPVILAAMKEHLTHRAVVRGATAGTLQAFLEVSSVSALLDLQSILKKTQGVDQLIVRNLSCTKAEVTIVLVGGISALRFALQARGFDLTQRQNGEWWIARVRAS